MISQRETWGSGTWSDLSTQMLGTFGIQSFSALSVYSCLISVPSVSNCFVESEGGTRDAQAPTPRPPEPRAALKFSESRFAGRGSGLLPRRAERKQRALRRIVAFDSLTPKSGFRPFFPQRPPPFSHRLARTVIPPPATADRTPHTVHCPPRPPSVPISVN